MRWASNGFRQAVNAKLGWLMANVRCLGAAGPEDGRIELTELGLSLLEEPEEEDRLSMRLRQMRLGTISVTPAQRKVLEAIKQFMDAHGGMAPTQKELAEALGGIHPASVRDHLIALDRRGAIRFQRNLRRGLEILPGSLSEPNPWAALRTLMSRHGIPPEEVRAAFATDDPSAYEEVMGLLRGPSGESQGQPQPQPATI